MQKITDASSDSEMGERKILEEAVSNIEAEDIYSGFKWSREIICDFKLSNWNLKHQSNRSRTKNEHV